MPIQNGHVNRAYENAGDEAPPTTPPSRSPSANHSNGSVGRHAHDVDDDESSARTTNGAHQRTTNGAARNGQRQQQQQLQNGVGNVGNGDALRTRKTTSNNSGTTKNGHIIVTQSVGSDDLEKPSKCGLTFWQPQCLQRLAHPLTFVLFHALLVGAQSILVSGYIAGSISTIEKRYNFQSVQSGAIVSSYEVTCIVGVILVSYIGGKFNRAHWLGYGAFFIAIGSFLYVLPHAIGGRYDAGGSSNSSGENLCSDVASNECGTLIGQTDNWAMVIFILAMLVIGFGASPVYTLGPTYLFDNCKRSNYGVYIGIVYCCGAVGPAAGFMLSALFLSYYVDMDQATNLDENDSQWIGAWWLGFIICGFLNIMVAVPLLFFPKSLPQKFSSENADDDVTIGTMKSSFREFPSLVKSIFSNLPWLFVSLAAVMEASIATGFVTFIAKFLQVTYALPASRANIVAGGVVIPGACSGIMIGGYLMKRFKLPLSDVAKMCCAVSSVCIIFYIGMFFLGCHTLTLAGVTVHYNNGGSSSSVTPGALSLVATCNTNCVCSTGEYEPVCGADGLTYYSPCFAGCTNAHAPIPTDGVKNFSSCACVSPSTTGQRTASDGTCPDDCTNLIPLLVVLFIIVVMSFINQNPALLITLGCVEKHERSFALGLQSFLVRILAYIPAPIYFGYLFDSQCVLWQTSCNQRGACLEYNRSTLPWSIFGVGLGLKVLSVLCTMGVWLTSRNKDKMIVEGGGEVSDPRETQRRRRDVVADLDRRLNLDTLNDRYQSSHI